MSEAPIWHVIIDGTPHGPLTFEQLQDLVGVGGLAPESMIWKAGDPAWRRADNVEGLYRPPAVGLANSQDPLVLPKKIGPDAIEPGHARSSAEIELPITRSEIGSRSKNIILFYIATHWMGQYSLARSYWLNSFVGGIALLIISGVIVYFIGDTDSIAWSLVALVLYACFWVIVVIWQVVGVWRSAERTKAENHTHFWPVIAQIMMVFGIISNLTQFSKDMLPTLTDLAKAMNGDPDSGPHGIRTLREGAELEISGPIVRGVDDDLEQALDKNPQVTLIHLDSPGGRLIPAMHIAAIVKQHHLDTYVFRECSSACTIVFLAGQKRWLGEGARIGFHSGSFLKEANADANTRFSVAMRAQNIPETFINHAISTPPDQMWYPKNLELINAGVITGIATTTQFALSGLGPHPTAQSAAALLNTLPLLTAIQQGMPEQWEKLRDQWVRTALTGDTTEAYSRLLKSTIVNLSTRLRPVAADSVALDLAKLVIHEGTLLQKKNPEVCWEYLFRGTVDIAPYLNSDDSKYDNKVTTDFIVETLKNPGKPVSKDDGNRLLLKIFEILKKKNLDSAYLFRSLSDTAPHDAFCPAIVNVYQAALELPPDEGAKFVRFMASD